MKTKVEVELEIPEGERFVKCVSSTECGTRPYFAPNLNAENARIYCVAITTEPIPPPLEFPPELLGVECAGIAMDKGEQWWAYNFKPTTEATSSTWVGSPGLRLTEDFFPFVRRLTAIVRERGLNWRQTWIEKPRKDGGA